MRYTVVESKSKRAYAPSKEAKERGYSSKSDAKRALNSLTRRFPKSKFKIK